MQLKFYRCKTCKKTIISQSPLSLGVDWEELAAGTTEGAKEKHIPVVTEHENALTVSVGSVSHPMSAEHLIEWAAIETEKGYAVRYFTAEDAPEATFPLAKDDKVQAVYAYCNLHGLWKA